MLRENINIIMELCAQNEVRRVMYCCMYKSVVRAL